MACIGGVGMGFGGVGGGEEDFGGHDVAKAVADGEGLALLFGGGGDNGHAGAELRNADDFAEVDGDWDKGLSDSGRDGDGKVGTNSHRLWCTHRRCSHRP